MDATVAIWNDHSVSHRTRHVVVVCASLMVTLIARSAAGAAPAPASGTPVCRDIADATTDEYLTGMACPPDGFTEALGYEPSLERTASGWRYTRPTGADGGCSGPLADIGPFWNFAASCRAHDYGYDLVRFGVGRRTDADAQLYRDTKATCALQSAVARPACKTIADSMHAVLWFGDVSPGFEPTLEPAA